MTESEALEILKKHNIHRGIYDTERLFLRVGDEVIHGEQIGEIYTGQQAIYLADYIPSVIGSTYSRVHKSLTMLESPRAHIRLEDILNDLPISVQRYEESIRRERIENLHEYFKKRNDEWTARSL